MNSFKIMKSLSIMCFYLGFVFIFLAYIASQLEEFQRYAISVGAVGGVMFFLWLAVYALHCWRENSRYRSMNGVLQELEERGGEAPLPEFMDSIFAKRRISYDTQREYFAVFERCGLIEVSDEKIRLKKEEGERANSTLKCASLIVFL